MFCESWRETLSAAALRSEELTRDAGSHLSGCHACRAAFAEERQLFGAIDQGLRALANAEVPASLIPRVRLAIVEQPASATRRLPVWAFAGATLLLIVAIAYEWSRAPHPAVPPQPVAAVAPATISSPIIPNPHAEGTPFHSTSSPRLNSARLVSTRREPEILVSGEEQANLLLYLNRPRPRNVNNAAPQVILAGDAQIKPLEIARLDVPELTIKPLEDGDSR